MNPIYPFQLPTGLLLDLDDTIITYDAVGGPAWRAACETYADRCGVAARELDAVLDEVRHWYWSDRERNRLGRLRLDETRLQITQMGLQRLGINDPELAAAITEEYRQRRDRAIDFFPGARETLVELGRRGIPLALITNGESHLQRAKIERFSLEPFFQAICVEGEMGFGKPDPRAFEQALQGLGLTPADVWMVGDNLEWDIAGAQDMGIFAVWNDYRKRGLPEPSLTQPDHTIHQLADLIPQR